MVRLYNFQSDLKPFLLNGTMNVPSTPEHEIVSRRKQKRLIEIFSPLRNHQSVPRTAYKNRIMSAIKEMPSPSASGDRNTVVAEAEVEDLNYGLVDTSKIFNDHVHANIKLEGLSLRIIDTPEFQRLHGLKQNGTADFVFRGATHTRFEHSLGVAHLAERFVKTLQSNQSDLGITESDILCVKIAGLCHDLGHGPFSHVYDGVFLKRMYPNGIDVAGKKWRHEDGSIRMLRHLLIKNEIDITEYGLNVPSDADAAVDASALRRGGRAKRLYNDMTFIEEIINGTPEAQRVGRDADKFFLYDIVNNLRSGLDVDKLDYFQRDMKMCNVFPMPVVTFDRFLELGLVLPATPIGAAEGLGPEHERLPKMICYPEKMASEALNLFAARFHMHQKVYQHKAVKQVEFMITEALALANPYIDIKGAVTSHHPKGLYKISECIYDMTAMSNLKDSVVDVIMHSADPRLQPAQHIITRVLCRDLYSCVGDTAYSLATDVGRYISSQTEEEIAAEIVQISRDLELQPPQGSTAAESYPEATARTGGTVGFMAKSLLMSDDESECEGATEAVQQKRRRLDVTKEPASRYHSQSQSQSQSQGHSQRGPLVLDDFIVEKMHIHYGARAANPVANLRFYSKTVKRDGHPWGRAVDTEQMVAVPRDFEVFKLRLFCKSPHAHKEGLLRQAFETYCSLRNVSTPFPSSSQG